MGLIMFWHKFILRFQTWLFMFSSLSSSIGCGCRRHCITLQFVCNSASWENECRGKVKVLKMSYRDTKWMSMIVKNTNHIQLKSFCSQFNFQVSCHICKMSFIENKQRVWVCGNITNDRNVKSRWMAFSAFIVKNYTQKFAFALHLLHELRVTLQPTKMKKFATTEYFTIPCFRIAVCTVDSGTCQEYPYCCRHFYNLTMKNKQHTYSIYIQSKWVGALHHPPDKSEVSYLQGCHAGTFSQHESQTTKQR